MTASGKSGSAAGSVYLVFGEDEYTAANKAREIVEKLCPLDQQTLGLEVIEGRVDTVADAVTALTKCIEGFRTVGFFGGRKVVWLRDAVFLYDSVTGRSDDVKARLEILTNEIKKGLAPEQFLVVSGVKVDGRSAFFKACKAAGTVFAYEKPDQGYKAEQQAAERAEEALERAGLSMRGGLIEDFVRKTGTDTRQIVQEVEKLAVYLGAERNVRPEDIDAVVCSSRDAMGWDLADAVGSRDLPRALATMRRLFAQKESPVGLIFILEGRFRDLAVMRSCMDRGWVRFGKTGYRTDTRWSDGEEVESTLGWMGKKDPRKLHPYRAYLLSQQAARFTADQLDWCRRRILSAHERMISSGVPSELVLEFLILELAGLARPKAAAN
ncbi:MAG: DNA polymerase III subunit delta [Kiritimatiellae bacterium]|nr:DNA polymerase III subunit delta [Kiritimatiellia bacterium]